MASPLDNFIPMEKLGEGSYSSVYKVKRVNDSHLYALKKIKIGNLKPKQKSNALNEIRILASLTSPYIITYKQAFFDQKINLLCIVMEWANQGDLFKEIESKKSNRKMFSERDIWKAAYHITSGLEILHSKNILHRDLKSANIFISSGVYKLGDLNVSKVNHEQKLAKTQTGTPYYASPQIWRDEPYGCKSDIWSLGCILYQMCCLCPPFHGKDLNQLYKNVQRGYYTKIPTHFSTELRTLIANCLSLRADDRPLANEMIACSGIIVTKCDFYDITMQKQKINQNHNVLMATIKMPNDMAQLNKQLPDSQYDMAKKSTYPSMNVRNNTKSLQMPKALSKSKENSSKAQINNIVKNRREKLQMNIQAKNSLLLPQKIKNHINSVNNVPNPQKLQSRKYLPIRKTYNNQNLQLQKKIEECISASKEMMNKRHRPVSCHIRKQIENKVQANDRPSSVAACNYRIKNAYVCKKQVPVYKAPLYEQQYPIVNMNKYQVRRIRSAHHREIPESSYCQIKRRMQLRSKNIENNEPELVPLARQHIKSQNSVRILKYKHLPYMPYSQNLQSKLKGNYSLVNNLQRKNDRNSYLVQIQNKILNSSNICDRKINRFYDDIPGRRALINRY